MIIYVFQENQSVAKLLSLNSTITFLLLSFSNPKNPSKKKKGKTSANSRFYFSLGLLTSFRMSSPPPEVTKIDILYKPFSQGSLVPYHLSARKSAVKHSNRKKIVGFSVNEIQSSQKIPIDQIGSNINCDVSKSQEQGALISSNHQQVKSSIILQTGAQYYFPPSLDKNEQHQIKSIQHNDANNNTFFVLPQNQSQGSLNYTKGRGKSSQFSLYSNTSLTSFMEPQEKKSDSKASQKIMGEWKEKDNQHTNNKNNNTYQAIPLKEQVFSIDILDQKGRISALMGSQHGKRTKLNGSTHSQIQEIAKKFTMQDKNSYSTVSLLIDSKSQKLLNQMPIPQQKKIIHRKTVSSSVQEQQQLPQEQEIKPSSNSNNQRQVVSNFYRIAPNSSDYDQIQPKLPKKKEQQISSFQFSPSTPAVDQRIESSQQQQQQLQQSKPQIILVSEVTEIQTQQEERVEQYFPKMPIIITNDQIPDQIIIQDPNDKMLKQSLSDFSLHEITSDQYPSIPIFTNESTGKEQINKKPQIQKFERVQLQFKQPQKENKSEIVPDYSSVNQYLHSNLSNQFSPNTNNGNYQFLQIPKSQSKNRLNVPSNQSIQLPNKIEQSEVYQSYSSIPSLSVLPSDTISQRGIKNFINRDNFNAKTPEPIKKISTGSNIQREKSLLSGSRSNFSLAGEQIGSSYDFKFKNENVFRKQSDSLSIDDPDEGKRSHTEEAQILSKSQRYIENGLQKELSMTRDRRKSKTLVMTSKFQKQLQGMQSDNKFVKVKSKSKIGSSNSIKIGKRIGSKKYIGGGNDEGEDVSSSSIILEVEEKRRPSVQIIQLEEFKEMQQNNAFSLGSIVMLFAKLKKAKKRALIHVNQISSQKQLYLKDLNLTSSSISSEFEDDEDDDDDEYDNQSHQSFDYNMLEEDNINEGVERVEGIQRNERLEKIDGIEGIASPHDNQDINDISQDQNLNKILSPAQKLKAEVKANLDPRKKLKLERKMLKMRISMMKKEFKMCGLGLSEKKKKILELIRQIEEAVSKKQHKQSPEDRKRDILMDTILQELNFKRKTESEQLEEIMGIAPILNDEIIFFSELRKNKINDQHYLMRFEEQPVISRERDFLAAFKEEDVYIDEETLEAIHKHIINNENGQAICERKKKFQNQSKKLQKIGFAIKEEKDHVEKETGYVIQTELAVKNQKDFFRNSQSSSGMRSKSYRKQLALAAEEEASKKQSKAEILKKKMQQCPLQKIKQIQKQIEGISTEAEYLLEVEKSKYKKRNDI